MGVDWSKQAFHPLNPQQFPQVQEEDIDPDYERDEGLREREDWRRGDR